MLAEPDQLEEVTPAVDFPVHATDITKLAWMLAPGLFGGDN